VLLETNLGDPGNGRFWPCLSCFSLPWASALFAIATLPDVMRVRSAFAMRS